MKFVRKQIEIIKKTMKTNQKYGKDDEKMGQQKKTRTETYIKGSQPYSDYSVACSRN